MTNYQEFVQRQKVSLGDGDVQENMQFKVSQPKKCVFYQVLYVSKLACNLFSVRAAAEKGNHVKFGHSQ